MDRKDGVSSTEIGGKEGVVGAGAGGRVMLLRKLTSD